MDIRTRQDLLNALAGKVGKRMDTPLIPHKLLCCISLENASAVENAIAKALEQGVLKLETKPNKSAYAVNLIFLITRRLHFDPFRTLYFPDEAGKHVTSAVRIKNASKSHVAFKLTLVMPTPFPNIIIYLISGTILTISKDKVKPSPMPDSWKSSEIFTTCIILGIPLMLKDNSIVN
ncbi:hypothetical protein POM88_042499 [Heracleum sosnowskyi]|uniref:Uncharacterized protein n=1 Tax=Heracleum sosnowskyi TaxID=360622 RepID=A0AAD8HHV1_9APIA|nr:hypothetical protein POM88_042499 [Heracleum sosnowskyi]